MITVFNRAELITTGDHELFRNTLDVLKANGLKYSYKRYSPQLNERSKKYGLGNTSGNTRYTVYVSKADLEKARYLLKNLTEQN